jgi:electron transfer flavoprotein beta subunit
LKVATIAVLVGRVPDPDRISVDRKTGKLITADIPYVLNPVDLSAIELGLQIKEKTGAELVALSLDERAMDFEMREALAMGCDRGLIIEDEWGQDNDPMLHARVLRLALERLVKPQLVLAASRSVDHMWSSVGPILAALLDWPMVVEAESLRIEEGQAVGVAHTGAFRSAVKSPLPAVVTVARGAIKPRRPTTWGVSAAFDEKKIDIKTVHDLGIDPTTEKTLNPQTKVLRVQQQDVKRERRKIEGDPKEVGRILARRLADQGWAGRRP